MTESDLSEYVRSDLESLGYTVYAEVCLKGGGSARCDFYARAEDPLSDQYGFTIAFEAKLNFNFKVLEQANTWTQRANQSFVLIPTTFKNMSTRRFGRELCKLLGIGVMEVNMKTGTYNVTVQPRICTKPNVPALYPEQRLIKASNADNKFMTPFKATVQRMSELFKKRDDIELNEIVQSIKHHYKSDIAARRNIKNYIDKNVIRGYYTSRENSRIVVHKNAMTNSSPEDNFFEQ